MKKARLPKKSSSKNTKESKVKSTRIGEKLKLPNNALYVRSHRIQVVDFDRLASGWGC